MTLTLTPYAMDTIDTIEALRAAICGTVYLPGENGYDAARHTWNTSVQQHPAVIVYADNTEDIAQAVNFARSYGMGVAVQATGHGVIGVPDDAMLIVTERMSVVTVNAQAKTATVQAGAKWGAVLAMAQEHGLAPLLGSSPTVGAVGYTLGGGMGWLARKYGMAVDSVIEFEAVTANGEIIRANEHEHAELFWGLRGGGKGLGVVVTEMTIQLYPVTTIYGGSLIYPIEEARDVFQFYREWIKYLPDEWTTSIAVMNLPPLPELPPFLSGKSVVMVTGAFVGDPFVGQMMIHTWNEWLKPIANTFHPMPFTEVATVSNDPQMPSPAVASGAWLKDLSDDTIDTLLSFAAPKNGVTPPVVKAEVRYAGGAIARNNARKTAYSHRSETNLLNVIAMTPTPEIKQMAKAYIDTMKAALAPRISGEYMNFLEGEEARSRAHRGFEGDTFVRLAALKAQYDPENMFRFGFDFSK